jgi:hypothetical protein
LSGDVLGPELPLGELAAPAFRKLCGHGFARLPGALRNPRVHPRGKLVCVQFRKGQQYRSTHERIGPARLEQSYALFGVDVAKQEPAVAQLLDDAVQINLRTLGQLGAFISGVASVLDPCSQRDWLVVAATRSIGQGRLLLAAE